MTTTIRPMPSAQYYAGKVRRWHTCVGMEQNNADHSHGVALIIALLHPNPSANLLKAALTHDLGELIFGDMPSQAKQDPEIRALLLKKESEARHAMGIPDFPLTEDEKLWLAFADAYETYMFVQLVGQAGSVISGVEEQLITNKMFKNAKALGLEFDLRDPQPTTHPSN